jgi:hypothetical protein
VLTITATRELAVEILAPLLRDMTAIRTGWWGRPAGDGQYALLGLPAWKGGRLVVVYGVSCAYVPHWEGIRWHWHRTLAQARPDMRVDPVITGLPAEVAISQLRGERAARADARRVLRRLTGPATAFWAATDSPARVRDTALEQAARGISIYSPHPLFVAAFASARLGDLPAARAALDRCASVLEPAALSAAADLLESVVPAD